MIGPVLPAQTGDIIYVITRPLEQQIGQRREIIAASRPVIQQMKGVFLQRFFRRPLVGIMVVNIIVDILGGAAVLIQYLVQPLLQLQLQQAVKEALR